MFEDNLTFLEKLLIAVVDQRLQCVCSQSLEVHDIEQLILQPLLVLVLILDKAITELRLDVGEDVQQFIKVLSGDHTDGGVVLGLDGGGAFRAGEESDFTEVLAWIQSSYKPLLPLLILNEAFTLALGYDEEVVGGLTLLDLDLLRLAHHKLDLGNYIVLDFRVQCKYQVLL